MSTIIATVPGCGIPLYDNGDGSYTITAKKFDVDGDGIGGNRWGDPDFQPHTSYKPDLNADTDPFYVFPPIVFLSVPGKVMGCKSRIVRKSTGQVHERCFPGDVGPHAKLGEGATCLAQFFDPVKNPNNGFEGEDFEITFWPDVPAEGRTLQSYHGTEHYKFVM